MDIPRLKHTNQSFEIFYAVLRSIFRVRVLKLRRVGVMVIKAFFLKLEKVLEIVANGGGTNLQDNIKTQWASLG